MNTTWNETNGERDDLDDGTPRDDVETPNEKSAEAEEQLSLADSDERLPWLESDDDHDDETVDIARLVIVGLVGLAVVLGLLGLAWWFSQPSSDGELLAEGGTITAPDAEYRSRPDDPGGAEVAGTGDLSFEIGEGQSHEAQLADDGDDVRPSIDREQASQASAATGSASAAAAAGTAAASSSASGSSADSGSSDSGTSASGVGIQVAAYTSRARAEQGWNDLSGRYDALQGLKHRVVEASVDGATVYRLQAVAGTQAAANSICRALKAAGGDCQVKP